MLYKISDKFQHMNLEEAFGCVITEAAHMAARQEQRLNPMKLPYLLLDVLVPVEEAPPAPSIKKKTA